jgi:hypothetical protein
MFDAAPELLAAGNGVINLRAGDLRPMVPEATSLAGSRPNIIRRPELISSKLSYRRC